VTPIISNLAEKHPKLKPAFITQDNSSTRPRNSAALIPVRAVENR
jgi:hypothetical protein